MSGLWPSAACCHINAWGVPPPPSGAFSQGDPWVSQSTGGYLYDIRPRLKRGCCGLYKVTVAPMSSNQFVSLSPFILWSLITEMCDLKYCYYCFFWWGLFLFLVSIPLPLSLSLYYLWSIISHGLSYPLLFSHLPALWCCFLEFGVRLPSERYWV